MNRNEIINRVAAIVLAIVLWVYVISVVNPPTTVTVRQVPVTLLNQEYLDESKLAIAGDGNYTVDVDLSGKRKDLILSPSDLNATADLSGLTPGQNYITVKVTSPSNTTVESIRTEKIQVYVDNLVSVDKPIYLDVANVPSGTEFTVLDLERDLIPVSGAKSLVDMVDHLTVHVDASGLAVDETTEQQYAITPMDAGGNVVKAVKLDSTFVSLSSTLYTVKSVPLYTRVDGAPGYGLELVSSSIPATVSIKGTLLNLAKINYIDAQPLDITDITTNTELPVVPILPDGIELAADNGALIASFTLSDQASLQMEADSSQVVLENLPEGFTAAAEGEPFTMQVTVKGPVETIANLTADMFSYYVDLSAIEEAGEYDLAIYTGTTIGEALEVVIEPAELHVLVESVSPDEDE
ncbi:MAG: hypothetical protein J6A42_05900 [Firmicutes bacterium]|nr:hypothetical protein [Bacillota bacterium]